jgi:DNA polymerase-3 subunit epsilon
LSLNHLLNLKRPLLFFDLETTGIHKDVDRILQIGIIKIYPDGTVREWSTLVNPQIPISAEASSVHGITEDMVQDAPTFEQIVHTLKAGFTDTDVAGYNVVKFDMEFLKAEFNRVGVPFPTGHRFVDAFKIFQRQEPRNLTAAVKFFLNKALDGAHDAMNDVRATVEVLEAQLLRYPDLPRSIEELHTLFFETPQSPHHVDVDGKFVWRNGDAVINFGKHRGKRLDELPEDYLSWIVDKDFPDSVKDICRQALNGQFPKRKMS